jgi:UDP-N-acetylglucosamine 2-epimerase
MKIASIVGARPQFIKLAPLARLIQSRRHSKTGRQIEHIIVHTGQHYDYVMNDIFFKEMGIPVPDYNLEVGSGSHGWQTAEILKKTEKVLRKEKPDWTLVYGDTNSTLAGALAAAKLNLRLAHIEAGLRSYDRRMPEEINRIVTDHCSQILFCPTQGAVGNLAREGFKNIVKGGRRALTLKKNSFVSVGVPFPWVVNVGDLMNDALLLGLTIAQKKSTILKELRLKPRQYYLATIHRAENTDDPKRLTALTKALLETSLVLPVVFPIHPRTKKYLDRLSLLPAGSEGLKLISPVSYFDMLILEKNAKIILTDSGGIQKEAYLLKVPCITLRDTTEWPETVESGWNSLAGSDPRNLQSHLIRALKKYEELAASRFRAEKCAVYGKGDAAQQILTCLAKTRI